MHKAVIVLGLAACTGQERTIDVTALRGDQPEPGAVVIAHHANGDRFDDVHVDANGHASVRVGDGDLVTLVYPSVSPANVYGTQLFTVAPTEDIVVHGPTLPGSVPSALGTLSIAPNANADADAYYVESSCGWINVTTFPQTLDVDGGCLGRDGQVPVVVTAYKQGQPIAYVAGLAPLTNGTATFSPTTWLPYALNVPIVTTGVSPHVYWRLTVDGVPVGPGEELSGAGLIPNGFVVESAEIRGWIEGSGGVEQFVSRTVAGAPSQIALSADDFLPQVPATLTASGLPIQGHPKAPLRFTWAKSDIGADVTRLSFGYLSYYDEGVSWTVILPPDSRGVDCLPFEGELDSLAPAGDPALQLTYIDSPDLHGYDEVLAAGVTVPDLNAMLVPPTTGEIRASSTGYGPQTPQP